jgi:predicted RNase H-like HicB family nuclease
MYPSAIHKDHASDYGVTVPDLPGCFSAGASLDETLRMAQEAVELHAPAEYPRPRPPALPLKRPSPRRSPIR